MIPSEILRLVAARMRVIEAQDNIDDLLHRPYYGTEAILDDIAIRILILKERGVGA